MFVAHEASWTWHKIIPFNSENTKFSEPGLLREKMAAPSITTKRHATTAHAVMGSAPLTSKQPQYMGNNPRPASLAHTDGKLSSQWAAYNAARQPTLQVPSTCSIGCTCSGSAQTLHVLSTGGPGGEGGCLVCRCISVEDAFGR